MAQEPSIDLSGQIWQVEIVLERFYKPDFLIESSFRNLLSEKNKNIYQLLVLSQFHVLI